MAGTVFFTGTDAHMCAEIAGSYCDQGWDAPTAKPDDFDVLDRIIEAAPVAAIFCAEYENGNATALLTQRLMADARFQRPLMVYLDCDEMQTAAIKEICPFGVFVKSPELAWVLKHLIPKQ